VIFHEKVHMTVKLSDKVAIITGAFSRIGRTTALMLAAAGVQVAIVPVEVNG
jgi:NAD(P)-dependent dehydrogenase (short-subunit alcohol dehydrogenase family)